MITLDENTWVLGYWFASDGESNWYLIMCKQDGEWIGQHTFRYNSGDDDPFLFNDKKSVYTLCPPKDMTEEEVLKIISDVFEFVKTKFNDYSDHFLVRGGAEEFMEIVSTKHYVHIKTED